MTIGLAWPVPGHTTITQAFGRTLLQAERASYEHNGYLVTDHVGPKVFRLARNGPIAGGVPADLVHPANDIACPIGSPVVAPHNGRVYGHGIDSVTGEVWLTLILPSKVELFFTHLSRVLVSVGETVGQGHRIALSGASGHALGPHLHWEVRSPVEVGPELDYPADRINPHRCLEGRDLAYYAEDGHFL